MKLRNKKTGDVVEDGYVRETHDFQFDGQKHVLAVFKGNGHRPPERISGAYTSLAKLNEEWEDYEEPKEHWCVTMYGGITRIKDDEEPIDDLIEIGNYFNSKEGAYDAWDKLKAWKRLKDKGMSLKLDSFRGCIDYRIDLTPLRDEEIRKIAEDLELLFSEEEE